MNEEQIKYIRDVYKTDIERYVAIDALFPKEYELKFKDHIYTKTIIKKYGIEKEQATIYAKQILLSEN